MVAPDVQIEDGKGTILISSEEGETEGKEEEEEGRPRACVHMVFCFVFFPSPSGRKCLWSAWECWDEALVC